MLQESYRKYPSENISSLLFFKNIVVSNKKIMLGILSKILILNGKNAMLLNKIWKVPISNANNKVSVVYAKSGFTES